MSVPIRCNYAITDSIYERFRSKLVARGVTWEEATAECMELARETFEDDVRSAMTLVYEQFERDFVRNPPPTVESKPENAQNSQARGTE